MIAQVRIKIECIAVLGLSARFGGMLIINYSEKLILMFMFLLISRKLLSTIVWDNANTLS